MRGIFLASAIFSAVPAFAMVGDIPSVTVPVVQSDVFVRGVVRTVEGEERMDDVTRTMIVATLTVELTSGEEKGMVVRATHERAEAQGAQAELHVGDAVVVAKHMDPDGVTRYDVSDTYRLTALWWFLALFVLLVIVLARWAGVRALAGLALSFIVILWFIVPSIASGKSPIVIGVLGTIGIASTTLFLAHGFRARTVIAFVSTIGTVLFAFALASLATGTMRLFGLGSEDAFYLQFAPDIALNMRGTLIAGITIGVLGVLDDVTTAQAAVVEELHHANRSFGALELFRRASSVGREHILSLVNTLILAYTGASLPLLLLFAIYDRPAWLMINSELMMEEIIRMLVGSIALILAIPITTVLAAQYFGKTRSG